MMNRIALCALFLLATPPTLANGDVSAIHKEIDRTVWSRFQDAFERLDGEALNAVYADAALRVTPDGIDTEGLFKQRNKTRFAANIANGDRIALDFWFDSRRTNESTSYDVGFYRVGITNAAKDTSYFYGQFHIVLKQIEGHWKIVQDWDTESIGGRPITAEDFARHTPVAFD